MPKLLLPSGLINVDYKTKYNEISLVFSLDKVLNIHTLDRGMFSSLSCSIFPGSSNEKIFYLSFAKFSRDAYPYQIIKDSIGNLKDTWESIYDGVKLSQLEDIVLNSHMIDYLINLYHSRLDFQIRP